MATDLLKSLIGSWECNCRTSFEPGKLADESTVRGTVGAVLEGRIVHLVYEGSMQGNPRHGEDNSL
jgi:uncharacterized protein DUF1579